VAVFSIPITNKPIAARFQMLLRVPAITAGRKSLTGGLRGGWKWLAVPCLMLAIGLQSAAARDLVVDVPGPSMGQRPGDWKTREGRGIVEISDRVAG
jgi:hypothetical protein